MIFIKKYRSAALALFWFTGSAFLASSCSSDASATQHKGREATAIEVAETSSLTSTETTPVNDSAYIEKVQKLLEDWKKDPQLKHTSWSFALIRNSDGKTISSHNEQLSLIPASTLKLVTTSAAMALLKDTFRFKTELRYSGELKDGVLKGNLHIVGGADPTLGYARVSGALALDALMKSWAEAIRKAGITKIEGAVIGETEGILPDDGPAPTWGWNDVGNYYAAGPYSLNIHENQYTLYLKSGEKVGSDVSIISTSPNMPEITFHNKLKAGAAGSGDNAYIYGAPFTNERWLRGTIPVNRSNYAIEGSMPEPALFAAQELNRTLKKAGIQVSGNSTTRRILLLKKENTPTTTLLHTTFSPPLKEIVRVTNFESNNLYAETLLAVLGAARGTGTIEDGAAAVQQFWKNRGIDISGWTMKDGSGLSRANNITAAQLSTILYMAKTDGQFGSFAASLPAAGREGTVRNICKGTAAEGKINCKSGSLNGIRCYAGYTRSTAENNGYSFAILFNNFQLSNTAIRKKIEPMLDAMAL